MPTCHHCGADIPKGSEPLRWPVAVGESSGAIHGRGPAENFEQVHTKMVRVCAACYDELDREASQARRAERESARKAAASVGSGIAIILTATIGFVLLLVCAGAAAWMVF